MIELATLADVKSLLSISDTDTAHDIDLQMALNASNRHVLTLARLTLEDVDVADEMHPNVKVGRLFSTNLRPIAGAIVVEGRWHGDSDWTTLEGDVEDAAKGSVRLLDGDSGSVRPWRPSPITGIGRHRSAVWPMLRVAYTAAASSAVEDLAMASAMLAADWHTSGSAVGDITDETAGQVSVKYADPASMGSYPRPVALTLSRYTTSAFLSR